MGGIECILQTRYIQKVKYFLLALERISCNNKIDDFSAAPNPLSWVKKAPAFFIPIKARRDLLIEKHTPFSS